MNINYTLELFNKEKLEENKIKELSNYYILMNKERLGKDILNPSQFFSEKLNEIIYQYNKILNEIEFFEEEYTKEDLIEIEKIYILEVKNEYHC